MDGWVPKGGALPPGDGAFERFLTAAIAAIITIMFSWRLLDEMNDAETDEAGRRRRAALYAAAHPIHASDRQIVEPDIDEDDRGDADGDNSPASDTAGVLPQSDSGYHSLAVSISSVDGQECSSVDLMKCFTSAPPVYLPSDGDGFSVGATISRNLVSDMDTATAATRDYLLVHRAAASDDSRELSDSDREFMEDGTTCFEWPPDSGEDLCNVSGDSDEVQPRELDSDEELYCCSLLEPIIEEDSDDFLSSSDDHDSLKQQATRPRLPPPPPPPLPRPLVCPSPDPLPLVSKQAASPTGQPAMKPSSQEVVEDVFNLGSPLIPVRSDNSSSHSQDADDSESDESVQTVVHRGSVSSDSKEGSLESSPLHGPRFFQYDHVTVSSSEQPQTRSSTDRYGVSVPVVNDSDNGGLFACAENGQDSVPEGLKKSRGEGDGSGQDGNSLEEEESSSSEDSDSEGEKTLDDFPDSLTRMHTAEVDTEVGSPDVAQLYTTPLSTQPPQALETVTGVSIDPACGVHAPDSSVPDDNVSGGSDTFIDKNAHFDDVDSDRDKTAFAQDAEMESDLDRMAEAVLEIGEDAESASGPNPQVASEAKTPGVIDSFLTEFEDEPFARRIGRRDRSPGRSDSSPGCRDRSPCRRDRSPCFRDSSPARRDRSPGRRDRSPGRRDTSPEAGTDVRSRSHPETWHTQETDIDMITNSDSEPEKSATHSDSEADRSAPSDTEPDGPVSASPFLVELEEEPSVVRPRGREPAVAKTDTDVESYPDHSPADRDAKTDTAVSEKEVRKNLDPLLTELEEEPFARRRSGRTRTSAVAMETDIDDVSPSEPRTQPAKDVTRVDTDVSVTRTLDLPVSGAEEEPLARRLGVGSDRVSIKSDRSVRSDTGSYRSGERNDSDLDRSTSRKSDTNSIDSYLVELDEEPFARRVGRRRSRSPVRERETESSGAALETSPTSAKPKNDTDAKTFEVIASPTVSKPVFSPPTATAAREDTVVVPDSPSVSLPPPSFAAPGLKGIHGVTSTPQKPDWRREAGKAAPIPESPTVCMPALLEKGPSLSLSHPSSAETSADKLRPNPFSDARVSNAMEEMPRGYTFTRCESESSRTERRIFLVDKPFFPDFETLINSVPCTSESVVGQLEGGAAVDYDEYSAFVQDLHRPALGSETEFTPASFPIPAPLGDACILSGNLASPAAVEVFQFPRPQPQPLLPAVSSVSQNLDRKDTDSEEVCCESEDEDEGAGRGEEEEEEEKSSKAEASSGGVLDTSFDIDSTQARERMETDFAFLQPGNNVRLPAQVAEKAHEEEVDDASKDSFEERMAGGRAKAEDSGGRPDDRVDRSDDEVSDERVGGRGERRRRRRRGNSGERDDRKRRRDNRRVRLGDMEYRSGDSINKSDDSNEILDSRKKEEKKAAMRSSDRKETADDSKDRHGERKNKPEDETSEKSPDKRIISQPHRDTSSTEQAHDTMPSEQAHDVMSEAAKTDSCKPAQSDSTVKLEEGAPILFFQPAALIHQDIKPAFAEPRRTQPQKPPRADSAKHRLAPDRAAGEQASEKMDSAEGGREDSLASKEDRDEEGSLDESPGAGVVSEGAERFQLHQEAPRPKPRQMTRPTPMPRSKSLGDTAGTPSGPETDEDDVFQAGASPADSDSHSSLRDDEEEEEELLFRQKHSAPLAFEERRPRSLKEIRRKLNQQRTQPRPLIAPFTLPDHMVLPSRLKILASRKHFLSAENLDSSGSGSGSLQEQFAVHKQSQQQVKERRYKSPNKRLRSPTFSSQDQLEKLQYMLNYSRHSESSFDRSLIDHLHEDCILTPQGRRNILDKTLSIENLQVDLPQHLRRYGSVTSLVETDIDTGETLETNFFPETNLDIFDCLFQPHEPLQRSASMSDLVAGGGERPGDEGLDQRGRGLIMAPPSQTHKSTGKGRFAYRKYQKSKSLCTLETNLDDVGEEGGDTLKRVPSVHELRVTKSLQKLNVPDWFKQSSLSKSSSCLLKYGSNSTMNSFSFSPSLISSPCASTAPPAPNVVIRTRVVPPSHPRSLHSPALLASAPPGERKAPPVPVKLPSEKLREKEKNKNLMPIPIIPFAQIRAMFEKKGKAAGRPEEQEKEKKEPSAVGETAKGQPTDAFVKSSVKTTSAVPSISISSAGEGQGAEPGREPSKPAKRTLFTDQPTRTFPSSAGDAHQPTVSSSSRPETVPRPAHKATNGVSDGVTVLSPSVHYQSAFVRTEDSSPPSSDAAAGRSDPTTTTPSPEKPPSQLPAASSAEQKPSLDLRDGARKDAAKSSHRDAPKSPDKDSKQQFSPTRSWRQFFGRSKDKSSDKKSDGGGGAGNSSLDSSFSSGDGVYEKEPRRLGVSEISKRFDAKSQSKAPTPLDRSGSGSGKEARSDMDSSFSSGDGGSYRTGEGAAAPKDSRSSSPPSWTFPASGTTRPTSHYNNSDRPEPPSTQPASVLYSRPEAGEQPRAPSGFSRPEASEPPAASRFGRPEVSEPPKFQRRLPGAGTAFGRLPSSENGDHVPEAASAPGTGTKATTDKKSIKGKGC